MTLAEKTASAQVAYQMMMEYFQSPRVEQIKPKKYKTVGGFFDEYFDTPYIGPKDTLSMDIDDILYGKPQSGRGSKW